MWRSKDGVEKATVSPELTLLPLLLILRPHDHNGERQVCGELCRHLRMPQYNPLILQTDVRREVFHAKYFPQASRSNGLRRHAPGKLGV